MTKRPKGLADLISISVAEAIDPDGNPAVVLALQRSNGYAEAYPLTPEFAEFLGGQLLQYAAMSRGELTVPEEWSPDQD